MIILYFLLGVIHRMRDVLAHGGPDDAGLFVDNRAGVALGHRRLSILDLSPAGRQPMEFDGLVITYNGEVYNFREIRKELEREGYRFRSNSDTEVVLKAYHRWGLEAVHRFRGMFAFAIWDGRKRELVLCRDRIGVKPLYWYYREGLFLFASELKAFHRHPGFRAEIEPEALALYLSYGYIPAPYAIFKGAYKLEPGHFLVVRDGGSVEKVKYWDVRDFFYRGLEERELWLKRDEKELARELEELLVESFRLRLVSDVPVGMFLSGGIDSSTVCALLAKEGVRLKTFTIGFYEKRYDEAPYARKVAEYLGTDHTELYCTPKEAYEVIPRLPELYDEPFGDSSAIPTYLVSRLARGQVKVSLSADGGDEQFCGYNHYFLVVNRLYRLKKLPVKRAIRSLLNLLSPEVAAGLYRIFRFALPEYPNFRDKFVKLKEALAARTFGEQYEVALRYFLDDDLKRLGLSANGSGVMEKVETEGLDPFSRLMLTDLKYYLPDDILVKVDRATMGVALEGRDPFLDHKIVEWTSRLPVEFKYRNGKSKYLLRKVLYRYVPARLLERPKQGFGVPVYEWFRGEFKGLYLEYLSEDRIRSGGIFNPAEVSRLLHDYLNDRGVNHVKLWLLFVFELWRERYGV